MRRRSAHLLILALAAVVLVGMTTRGRAFAQPRNTKPAKPAKDAKEPAKEEKVDPYERAEAVFRAGRFGAAIPLLRDFITASVGDSRLPAAREMLLDAYRGKAERCARDDDPGSAARVLMDGATFFKTGDEAEGLRLQARSTLEGAFNAHRQKDPERAAEAAVLYARLFKDDPPLADEQALHQLQAAALAQLVRKKAPPEFQWAKLAAVHADGVPLAMLQEQKIDPAAIQLAYAEELTDKRKWYSRAIEILRGLEQTAPDEQAARRYQVLIAKALGMHAEAALALGNHESMEQAVLAAESYPGALNTPGGRKLKAARAKSAAKSAKPLLVETEQPLVGEGNLVDSGGGIVIPSRIQIGRDKGDGRNDGVITVPAGGVIDGGKIAVERGKLLLKGDPTRPVVLRNVEISCTISSEFVAENAVLIDCKFWKAGGWFFEFYTSKWTFNNCTLLRSNFHNSLSKTDFGIKLTKCTLIECKFPQRLLHRDKPDDVAARYQDDWNKVEDCDFYQCEVRPSFVWATERCNFTLCKVTGADVFQSTTPLTVSLYASKLDGAFTRDLGSNTDSAFQGAVRYVNGGKEFPRKGGSALWPWVVGSRELLGGSARPAEAASATDGAAGALNRPFSDRPLSDGRRLAVPSP